MEKRKVILSFLLIFLVLNISSFVLAEDNETEEANCTEQLLMVIEEHNALIDDYKQGKNCGEAFQLVKDLNTQLSEENEVLKEEVKTNKQYRTSFFIMLSLLIVSWIIFFIPSKKK